MKVKYTIFMDTNITNIIKLLKICWFLLNKPVKISNTGHAPYELQIITII